nr:hypothetical protein [Tanacetum cinerariifolium]
ASDSSVNESKKDNNQANDRYKAGEGYHAVPPPYTGTSCPQEFTYPLLGLKILFISLKPSAPIIEEWESNSDDDHVIRPSVEQNKLSYAKINFVKPKEHTRKSVIDQWKRIQLKQDKSEQNRIKTGKKREA